MPALPWIPAFSYGANPTTWAGSIPQRPWTYEDQVEGGSLTVASGLTVAYDIREDKLLGVVIRVRETELVAFRAAVSYGLRNPGSLTFYPDGLAGAGYLVYVESPRLGERWSLSRSGDDPSVFEARLTLRRVDGQAWNLDFYGA